MKKQLFFLLMVPFILVSCNLFHKSSPKLYIKTFTSVGTSNDPKLDAGKISVVSTDYFEISLKEQATTPLSFLGTKDLETPSSLENFRMSFIIITNEKGENISFKTSTDFLNFMSGHGYEMVDQKKYEYRTDYTFKRK